MKLKTHKNIFALFLELLQVKHTRLFSNKLYGEHPNKNNLLGLSQMLSDYLIENKGLKFNNKEDLRLLEPPFIAYVNNNFATVFRTDSSNINFIYNGEKVKTTYTDFYKAWTGEVLVAEPNEKSMEPEYKENIKKENVKIIQKYILSFAIILFISSVYISNSIYKEIGSSILLLINLTGLYISYLLLLKQMHIHSNYADRICTFFKKGDCNNILESSAAKFMGIISWSEVGFSYFLSNIIIILFLPQFTIYSAIINICALPYTIWSIWYQKFKAKQWCTLCLIVQGLLWSIFITNILCSNIKVPLFSIEDIVLVGCIYTIPYIALALILPNLIERKKTEKITHELNSLKMKDEIFWTLLKKQPHYDINHTTSKILFGNPDSDMLITILSNPLCTACGYMHERVDKILDNHESKICIQYILTPFKDELAKSGCELLTAAYLNKNKQEAKKIFHEWFVIKKESKTSLFKEYKYDPSCIILNNEINKHAEWYKESKLNTTPTIMVNGYVLPTIYKIEDLIMII